ncbi:hypothetical protein M9H77_27947 [Catharanthus roseus]|uniref:Uncharacterized protein n=1 Tax=Catharanthus roseus TaxID=4058 RepID=A0ACC0AEC4_CATRO|nr:hypothetical protein M9H77_27947 [Catharanthus roseus]
MSIAQRKIQKSSDSGFYGFGSGLGFYGRGRPPRALRGKSRGRRSGRSTLSSVIDLSPSTFPYIDTFLSFLYLFIENWKNVNGDENYGYRVVADCVQRSTSMACERVYELIDRTQRRDGRLQNIANAFNLCVVLITQLESMTVLPLYSYLDRTASTMQQMRDGYPLPPLHVQWDYYHSDRVSGWAEAYSDRIAN